VREKGAFAKLCAAMNQQLVPVLSSAGFSSNDTPFRREAVRYEFRRKRGEEAEVIAVLFNREREALFSVQLYIEPREESRHSSPQVERCTLQASVEGSRRRRRAIELQHRLGYR
jgi:hypothetical protein